MTTTTTTREPDIGLTTIRIECLSASGESSVIAWMTRWDGQNRWSLFYKGENIGTTTKRNGLSWLASIAERQV